MNSRRPPKSKGQKKHAHPQTRRKKLNAEECTCTPQNAQCCARAPPKAVRRMHAHPHVEIRASSSMVQRHARWNWNACACRLWCEAFAPQTASARLPIPSCVPLHHRKRSCAADYIMHDHANMSIPSAARGKRAPPNWKNGGIRVKIQLNLRKPLKIERKNKTRAHPNAQEEAE